MGTEMPDPDLDRRLADWIRAGPYSAPRDVVDRALIETTTVVQLPPEPEGSVLPGILLGTFLAAVVFLIVVAVVLTLLTS